MPADSHPLAVVTGAASGIGLALARVLEDNGFELVAADADLRVPEGVERLAASVGRAPDVLALGAGMGQDGTFSQAPLDGLLSVVDHDCRAAVHLAKLLLPPMVQRGSGRVLITSATPAGAVGAASRSFTQSFALALREELAGTGVTVTSLMPGTADAGTASLAAQAFAATMAGEERVRGAAMAEDVLGRVAPESMKAKMFERMAKPGATG